MELKKNCKKYPKREENANFMIVIEKLKQLQKGQLKYSILVYSKKGLKETALKYLFNNHSAPINLAPTSYQALFYSLSIKW